jgi:tyrosinase
MSQITRMYWRRSRLPQSLGRTKILVCHATLLRTTRPLLIPEALHPFHRNLEGDFWTSETVRDHTIFAYTYPELLDLSDNDTLVRRVNQLYGPNATSQFSWDLRLAPALGQSSYTRPSSTLGGDESTTTSQDTVASSAAFQVAQDHQHGPNRHRVQGSDLHYQYFANIRTAKGGLEAAYKVYVFLDASPAVGEVSTATWRELSGTELVGFVGFQGMGGKEGMKATQDEDDKMMSVVALTEALEGKMRQGRLSSMDEATVGAYLQERMTWQIVTVSVMAYP